MFIFSLKTGMIVYRIEGVYMYDLGVQFHFSLEQAKSNPAAIIKGNNYRFTILSERPNPYYVEGNKRTAPYILCAKRFPILNENSNEYSIPALLYKYKIPIFVRLQSF